MPTGDQSVSVCGSGVTSSLFGLFGVRRCLMEGCAGDAWCFYDNPLSLIGLQFCSSCQGDVDGYLGSTNCGQSDQDSSVADGLLNMGFSHVRAWRDWQSPRWQVDLSKGGEVAHAVRWCPIRWTTLQVADLLRWVPLCSSRVLSWVCREFDLQAPVRMYSIFPAACHPRFCRSVILLIMSTYTVPSCLPCLDPACRGCSVPSLACICEDVADNRQAMMSCEVDRQAIQVLSCSAGSCIRYDCPLWQVSIKTHTVLDPLIGDESIFLETRKHDYGTWYCPMSWSLLDDYPLVCCAAHASAGKPDNYSMMRCTQFHVPVGCAAHVSAGPTPVVPSAPCTFRDAHSLCSSWAAAAKHGVCASCLELHVPQDLLEHLRYCVSYRAAYLSAGTTIAEVAIRCLLEASIPDCAAAVHVGSTLSVVSRAHSYPLPAATPCCLGEGVDMEVRIAHQPCVAMTASSDCDRSSCMVQVFTFPARHMSPCISTCWCCLSPWDGCPRGRLMFHRIPRPCCWGQTRWCEPLVPTVSWPGGRAAAAAALFLPCPIRPAANVPMPPLKAVRVGEASNPGPQGDIRQYFAVPNAGSQVVSHLAPCPTQPSPANPLHEQPSPSLFYGSRRCPLSGGRGQSYCSSWQGAYHHWFES